MVNLNPYDNPRWFFAISVIVMIGLMWFLSLGGTDTTGSYWIGVETMILSFYVFDMIGIMYKTMSRRKTEGFEIPLRAIFIHVAIFIVVIGIYACRWTGGAFCDAIPWWTTPMFTTLWLLLTSFSFYISVKSSDAFRQEEKRLGRGLDPEKMAALEPFRSKVVERSNIWSRYGMYTPGEMLINIKAGQQ